MCTSVFKGVPYAAAPVGELRWKAPIPALKWEGDRLAYRFSPTAMQLPVQTGTFYHREFLSNFPMSEDCLYLNIWTPAEVKTDKLPVAVWIHGGGFQAGAACHMAYDGEAFAKRGVIFISINYRLNIFGFLATKELSAESTPHSSGNYGMLDQIAALEWIQRNIEAFGGDPDNVTVFGQSGGAGSVVVLCTSPLSKGLFRRAIIQSSGGIEVRRRWSLQECESRGTTFLKAAGFSSIQEARKLSAKKLLEYYDTFNPKRERWRIFGPNVDGHLLEAEPIDVVLQGKHLDVDYLLGSTSEEGNAYPPDPNLTAESFREEAMHTYGQKAPLYLKLIGGENLEKLRYVAKHNMANGGLARNVGFCERQAEQGRKPGYLYYFSKRAPGDEAGAFHSSEHAYVFQTFQRIWRPYDGADYDLSNQMCDYWTNFVKYGNPNGNGHPQWTPFTSVSRMCMEFSGRSKMIPVPETEISKFQKQFIYNKIK